MGDMHTPGGEQEGQTSIERDDMCSKKDEQNLNETWVSKKDDVRIPIDEQQEHILPVVSKYSSTRELSSSSAAIPSIELTGEDIKLIHRIERGTLYGKANYGWESQTKIEKVPDSMRRKKIFMDKYCRKPKVIGIGFYAFWPKFRRIELKDKLVKKFLAECGEPAEAFLCKFKKSFTVDELIKEFFEDRFIAIHGVDELARMLFVDGCSVLQFINDCVNNDIEESCKISKGEVENICHDLFLLENQIPFEVLVILMRLSDKGFDFAKSLYYFVSMNTMAPFPYVFPRLFRKLSDLSKQKRDKKEVFEGNKNLPVHLLDLLRSEMLCENSSTITTTAAFVYRDWDFNNKGSFHNIQLLKEAGIYLKPDYSKGLRSASFSSRLNIVGRLKLPPLVVDGSTEEKLFNLVAYEKCLGNNEENYAVTSYVTLLDSLIKSEEDVKDLKEAHILRHNLSSDEQVVQLFRTIASRVPRDAYSNVKNDIQKHFELQTINWIPQFYKKIVNWKDEFYRDYCSSPWSFLALLATIAAFMFTGVQAYYTVNPKKQE